GRFDCSFHKKMEGAIKHSAEKQPDTTQTLTLTRPRHKTGLDIPRRGSQGGRRKPPCKKISVDEIKAVV
ncbi:MAG: hypothetical protein IKA22_08220, partial [Lentisphaeria bacterium]|nr:hypothetical protein [Lentisphaeria bacterium]